MLTDCVRPQTVRCSIFVALSLAIERNRAEVQVRAQRLRVIRRSKVFHLKHQVLVCHIMCHFELIVDIAVRLAHIIVEVVLPQCRQIAAIPL